MPRIYFDTNVFSNLRMNEAEKFKRLNQLINERKGRVSFFFSNAHIRDKRKDKSDFKFLDFEFMESLVEDNYLAYHPKKLKTGFYLATPKMAFDDDEPEDEFNIFDFFDPSDDDDEQMLALKHMFKASFESLPLLMDESILQGVPEEQKKLLAMFFPNKQGGTFLDVMKNMLKFSEDMQTDSELYKELRAMIDKGMNNGTITLNGEVDFNLALQETEIKKTYFDFIKDTVYQKDKGNAPYYDFYQLAYNMLDLMGISKDKITKKNTFGNLQNDGIHSYFARYCDYFVTDDKTTISKSKAIYNLLEINTKVLDVEEFIAILPELIEEKKDDWDDLRKKITWDIQHADRKSAKPGEEPTMTRFAKNHRYLDFFDAIVDSRSLNSYTMIMFKAISNPLSSPNFNESQKIIDLALYAFGEDDQDLLRFDYHKESGETNLVRIWTLGDTEVVELNHFAEIDWNYGMRFTFQLEEPKPLNSWQKAKVYLIKIYKMVFRVNS